MKDLDWLLTKYGFLETMCIVFFAGLFVIFLSFDNDTQTEKIITAIDEMAASENIVIQEVVKEVPVEVIKEVPVEVEKVVYKTFDNPYDAIEVSPEEYELLAEIVSLEATNQGDIGQRAVIEVCLNRVLNGWGGSLWEVLNASGQFATLQLVGSSTAWAKASKQEYNNIDYVLEHGATILPTDYVYFDTKGVNGKDHIRINGHYFGKE